MILVPLLLVLAQDLPDGPGKDITQKLCSPCHGLDSVIPVRRTKIAWQRMVDDMVSRGAEGTDDELNAVVAYLTANFGKLNVNTASAQEMEKTLGLPAAEAQAIVTWREKNGTIKDFEALKKIPGVTAATLDAKRPLIAFAL